MKATAQAITQSALVEKSVFGVFSELVKARLTALVLITTLVGFYSGSGAQMETAKIELNNVRHEEKETAKRNDTQ